MCAQVFKVKILRINGLLSPASQGGQKDCFQLGQCLTLSRHHIRDLDDGVDVGLREDTFATSALNIKA